MIIDQLKNSFNKTYHTNPQVIVRSPGRINLIGEHIDYNGGTVLPTTIDNAIYLAFSHNDISVVQVHTINLKEHVRLQLDHHDIEERHWVNCVIGVWNVIQRSHDLDKGIDISITSTLPIGSGLSSSSALCCGLIKGIASLHQIELTSIQIAELAFEIEHEFIGIQCGFMDQFAICHGRSHKAMVFDTQTQIFEHIDIPVNGCEWILIDSKINRSLHDSAYNLRRASCNHVVEIANEHLGYVEFLTDLTAEDLSELKPHINKSDYQKASFVIEEQNRVLKYLNAMSNNDFDKMGKLMYECQSGMATKYEVSCWEIDHIIEECQKNTDIYGARMIGGGFGGCVLVLARPFTDLSTIVETYNQEFEIQADIIPIQFGPGVGII